MKQKEREQQSPWMKSHYITFEEHPKRMEMGIVILAEKWRNSQLKLVIEKLKLMREWPEEAWEIRTALIEWMLENGSKVMVDEGEDILDGLEMMEKDGEVAGELLLDSTEIITMIIARNLCSDRMPITFQKAGKVKTFPMDGNRSEKCGTQRAASMRKMRELLAGKKNMRQSEGSKEVHEDDFPEMEFRHVGRRESS